MIAVLIAAGAFAAARPTLKYGWSAEPMSVDGDTVRTDGTLVYAYARRPCVVNTVAFAGLGENDLQQVVGRVPFDFDAEMFRDENPEEDDGYANLLNHYWSGVAAGERMLRLSGLVAGRTYLVQLVLGMRKPCAAGVRVSAPGGETARANGPGWRYGGSLIGVFKADADTESFALRFEKFAVMSAIQVREVRCDDAPPPMVRLVVPPVRHARLVSVVYDGRKAVPDGRNGWRVRKDSVAVVSFAAETGFVLEGDGKVRAVLGDASVQTLPAVPKVREIALPDDKVSMSVVAEYELDVDGCGGLAYTGSDGLFYLLQDHAEDGYSRVYPLTLNIDSATAAVTGRRLGTGLVPGRNRDSEGIAYDPVTKMLWISDETGPDVREYFRNGNPSGRSVPVPELQKAMKRPNRSLEALTLSPDGLTLWSANEQALVCDGESSDENNTVGTVVRLMKFVRSSPRDDWLPAGQWAYACDTSLGTSHSQSGVSGLCALPDGSLLVLEREVSTATWGRCRIYRVTPYALSKASDVSALSSLSDSAYTGVPKGRPLVDFHGPDMKKVIVYEGISLGPQLNDGSWSVYLVSDGGESLSAAIFTARTVNRLCALRIRGLRSEDR